MRLIELRSSLLAKASKVFPKMPDYVVRDLVYQAAKDDPSVLTDKGWIDYFSNLDWKHKILMVTIDIFNDETQGLLRDRQGGAPHPNFAVSKDAARHATQQKLIANGPADEPIIVLDVGHGYELLEGWHRTIQSLQKWPDGYKQAAWIGYYK